MTRFNPIKLLTCLTAIVLLTFSACIPPEEYVDDEIPINWGNKTHQHVYDLVDARNIDSLYRYMRHPDPAIRLLVSRGLGYTDPSVIDSLGLMMTDPMLTIREAAAFSLGLLGDAAAVPHLMRQLATDDSISAQIPLNRTIMEAIGRCGTANNLKQMTQVTSYHPTDTTMIEGLTLALYRFGLRGMQLKEGDEKMLEILREPAYPPKARLYAAHYLKRISKGIDSLAANELQQLIYQEEDANIRMAIYGALAKASSSSVGDFLIAQLNQESTINGQEEILKTLQKWPIDSFRFMVMAKLKSEVFNVAHAAGLLMIERGSPEDISVYYNYGRDSAIHPLVRLDLLAAGLRHVPKWDSLSLGAINYTTRRNFLTSEKPAIRAHALWALSHYPWNYRFIRDQSWLTNQPIIQVAGVQALNALWNQPNFASNTGYSRSRIIREITQHMIRCIESRDIGLVAESSLVLLGAWQDKKDAVVLDILSNSYVLAQLDTVLARIDLPQGIEAYDNLGRLIATIKGQSWVSKKLPVSKPIDWALLDNNRQHTAIISTARGDITLTLFPSIAPSSVSNFEDLAKRKYYNNKTFHRVVPNFVIQGGCDRGDGYGGPTDLIRTEVDHSLTYATEGYIGMASAGRDTEGSQFFITMSPTPHLDGRYTIFGKVTEGMNTVNRLAPGDAILKIDTP